MSANASKTKQQFNEQFYLLMQMIKGTLPSDSPSVSKFASKKSTNVPFNIIQDQDYEPSTLLNVALNAKLEDKQEILNLTTAQLSALVPDVKLYKVIDDSYKPFYFPNNTHPSEVSQIISDGGRLQGAGIQNFSVTFQGTDTFTADKLLDCSLGIYVQNMNSLFSDPPLAGDYAKLAELITVPPSSRKKKKSKKTKKVSKKKKCSPA